MGIRNALAGSTHPLVWAGCLLVWAVSPLLRDERVDRRRSGAAARRRALEAAVRRRREIRPTTAHVHLQVRCCTMEWQQPVMGEVGRWR